MIRRAPTSRQRRWPWRRSRLRPFCGASRPCSPSPPSQGGRSAASVSRRPRRQQLGPPQAPPPGRCTTRHCRHGPGRNVDDFASQLDAECEWLVANDVLPTVVVTRNRRIAEAVLRPWTPVFTHGALQSSHVFVDANEVTGVIDWSDAGQGDALFDLAILTLGHEDHLADVVAGYGTDVDLDLVRGSWSLRTLTAVRWLVEHG